MQTKPEQPSFPFQQTPVDSSPQASQNARLSSVRTDFYKAFHLLRRSSAARKFMLGPSTPSSDLSLLTTPHPSFTISTDEVQSGKLPGQIALRYLGIPAFADTEGLSGGLLVTSYANRTHPLHDPKVMADVRVGRYVRDNETGEWCIITRNSRDQIVRLQYMRVTPEGARERIGLTCSTELFDRGLFLESVLFKCHDFEWRTCHICASSLCLCRSSAAPSSFPLQLETVAQTVMREGADEWVGTVRVTVISNLSRNPLLNIDATMAVRSSCKPALDQELVHHMRRLAIIETVDQNVVVPAQTPIDDHRNSKSPEHNSNHIEGRISDWFDIGPAVKSPEGFTDSITSDLNAALTPAPQPQPLDPPKSPSNFMSFDSSLFALDESEQHKSGLLEWPFDDVFGQEGDEIADHFLIPSEHPVRFTNEEDVDCPMLPADPSTLPGGVDGCLEGMEFGDIEDEDDCFSLMTSDRDTRSVSSALSVAGSDDAPLVDSVPAPGDDVVDRISSLKLSSSSEPVLSSNLKNLPPFESVDSVCDEETLSTDNSRLIKPNVQCMSPINAPMSDTTAVDSKGCELPTSAKQELEICPELRLDESSGKPKKKEDEESTCSVSSKMGSSLIEDNKLSLKEDSKQGISVLSSPVAPPHADASLFPAAVPGAVPTLLPAMSFSGGIWIPFIGVGGAPNHLQPTQNGVSPSGLEKNDTANLTQMQFAVGRLAQAPRLAPRPAGVDVSDGQMWQVNMPGNPFAMVSRLDAIEKERKAEERRKKNRQAAARSNARKKDLMDGIKMEIQKSRQKAQELRLKQDALRMENEKLKGQVNCYRKLNC